MNEIELLNVETEKLESVMFFEYLSISLDRLFRGTDKTYNLLHMLSKVLFQIKLQPDDPKNPYIVQEQRVTTTASSMSVKMVNSAVAIDEFLKQYFMFSDEDLVQIDSPFIKARLYDLKWIKDKNIADAHKALDNYQNIPLTLENWTHDSESMLTRAIVLAKQVKRNDIVQSQANRIYQTVITLDLTAFQENLFVLVSVVRLLFKLDLIDKQNYEPVVDKLVNLASVSEQYPLPAYILCNDICKKFGNLAKAASTLFDGIQGIVENTETQFFNHQQLMQLKFELEKRIPKSQRVQEQYDKLLSIIKQKIAASGRNAVEKMTIQKTEAIDISEIVECNLSLLEGKNNTQALSLLFDLQRNPKFFTTLENYAQEDLANPSLAENLFATSTAYASDGRIILNCPCRPEDLSDINAVKKYLAFKKVQHFNTYFEFHCKTGFFPVLMRFIDSIDLAVIEGLINEIVDQSPIIPADRIKIITLGLRCGFENKFTEAAHILVPQFEHIVRDLLQNIGVNTITTDTDGRQNEIGLSSLMDRIEINQLFDEQTVFEIKSLFTEGIGFNLRNNMAHGLLADNSIGRLDLIYAWLFILRLICTHHQTISPV